jgi:hypothetical protein
MAISSLKIFFIVWGVLSIAGFSLLPRIRYEMRKDTNDKIDVNIMTYFFMFAFLVMPLSLTILIMGIVGDITIRFIRAYANEHKIEYHTTEQLLKLVGSSSKQSHIISRRRGIIERVKSAWRHI